MTGDASVGYVAGLLSRVSGRANGVKPRIPSYFADDPMPDVPDITEITRQETARGAEQSPVSSMHPEAADDTRTEVTNPAHAPDPTAAPPPPQAPRLFDPAPQPEQLPTVPSAPAQIAGAPVTARSPEPLDHAAPPPAAPSSDVTIRPDTAAPRRTYARPAPPQPDAPGVPNIAAEVAAAIASLRGDKSVVEPRIMPVTETPVTFVVQNPPAVSENGSESEIPEERSQPLHIHIGEIVIAPDTPATAAPTEPAKRADWAPNLTLDAYREARRKGAR
jgi:hypothetical protein